MSRSVLLAAAGLGALAVVPASSVGQSAPPRLELPVACQPGRTCFIQQYFDHDPGPTARDYRCGPKAYDAHKGVDIRVPSRAAMQAGVQVRAAAAGTVRNIRNTVPDHRGTAADLAASKGTDCGNGVVITHPGGYETQYCHMAQGSVSVRPGQTVTAGASLGRIGQSGNAQFPHLHFEMRSGPDPIDPFAPQTPNSCGRGGEMLWTPAAAAALAYRSPELLNAGFAAGPVSADAVEAGPVAAPTASSPALVAYVRAIGLEAGDRQQLRLFKPNGVQLAESAGPELKVPRAQQLMFVGERNKAGRFPPGAYKARYTVTRGARVVLDETFEVKL